MLSFCTHKKNQIFTSITATPSLRPRLHESVIGYGAIKSTPIAIKIDNPAMKQGFFPIIPIISKQEFFPVILKRGSITIPLADNKFAVDYRHIAISYLDINKNWVIFGYLTSESVGYNPKMPPISNHQLSEHRANGVEIWRSARGRETYKLDTSDPRYADLKKKLVENGGFRDPKDLQYFWESTYFILAKNREVFQSFSGETLKFLQKQIDTHYAKSLTEILQTMQTKNILTIEYTAKDINRDPKGSAKELVKNPRLIENSKKENTKNISDEEK